MDADDAFVIYGRYERGIRGVLDFGAIIDGCVLIGGKLTLLGVGVIPLEAEVGNVVVHGKATGAMGVVLFDIDARVQITLPVFSDVIVLFEGILKVMCMAVADNEKIRLCICDVTVLTSSGAFRRSPPLATPLTQHPPPTPRQGSPH